MSKQANEHANKHNIANAATTQQYKQSSYKSQNSYTTAYMDDVYFQLM